MISFDLYKKLKSPDGHISLEIKGNLEQGKLMSIYGPSGAGKTSVLRMLAGLLKADKGYIKVNGEIWFDTENEINLSPQNRRIGFVFQDYALFPNMTVLQNLEFALEKNQNNKIVNEMVEVIELGELIHKHPKMLSGGQQQRVALARALIRKPSLLLLDEPLSALDHEMRIKMQDYILKVHNNFNLHTILVSHQFSEVIKMSDQLIMINEGKVSKQGNASSIFIPKELASDLQLDLRIVELMSIEGVKYAVVLLENQLYKIKIDPESQNKYVKGGLIRIAVKDISIKDNQI